MARQSFSGRFGKGWRIAKNREGPCAYLSAVKRLPEAAERIVDVQIECQDFRTCIPFYDKTDVFMYLDPPYVHSTRKTGFYDNEMTDKDHETLIEILLTIKSKVMLSGYENSIYEPLEKAGWAREDFNTICHTSSGKSNRDRVESVWMNYSSQQLELF